MDQQEFYPPDDIAAQRDTRGAQPAAPVGNPQVPARRPRGFAVPAWILIALLCLGLIAMHSLKPGLKPATDPNQAPDDPVGVLIMELQGKYAVGLLEMERLGPMVGVYGSISALNKGSIAQRQRFVVLSAELVGPGKAAEKLLELDQLIAEEVDRTGGKFTLSPSQQRVQQILHELYVPRGEPVTDDQLPAIADISNEDRAFIETELGWFGKLALTPKEAADESARRAVTAPALRLAIVLLAGTFTMILAGAAGFVGLIVVGVLAFLGRIRFGLSAGAAHHGVYAETFALWMLLFVLLQIPAGLLGDRYPDVAMASILLAFFTSLAALAWPVIRGVRWPLVRADIGWTPGRQPALEPLLGVGGYLMALPLLAVGVAITFALVMVQQALSPAGPTFGPAGGPAHPVIIEVAHGGWWAKIQVLMLASIAAPIVEETMFRGVLYRHLRDASRMWRGGASVILSCGASAFVFAIVHPQGWVAVPALGSLAVAFALMREWRGTLLPCMLMHGISNLLVMSMLILALGG